MRKTPLLLLCGWVCLSQSPSAVSMDPAFELHQLSEQTTGLNDMQTGTHELHGPVKVLWEARYDGSASARDTARTLAISPDGSTVFVTGSSWVHETGFDYLTVAYSTATGEMIWRALYHTLDDSSGDSAQSLAVSPDGSTVFVTGQTNGIGTRRDYGTVAYNAASGEEVWRALYDGPALDLVSSLAVSPDGSTVFVTGTSDASEGTGHNWDYATVAYDAATGEAIWSARYDGPGSPADWASSLVVSPDGWTVFVTGTSWDAAATVAYNAASGEELWSVRSNSSESNVDEAYSMAVSPDGSTVFITGASYRFRSGTRWDYDYVTVAYDAASGEEVWRAFYNGPAEYYDYANSLAVSPDGSTVFVTGGTKANESLHSFDYATVAYSAASGEELWSVTYDGPVSRNDYGYSITINPEGSSVLVTGRSWSDGTGYDYQTLAYSAATGQELWSARYDGSASAYDSPSTTRSLAISPDGSTVFVTGESEGIGTDRDYATLAYSLPVWVDIDIKPGSDTNPINPRSRGVIPVALLGSDEFDVADVDVSTLRFGPSEAGPAHNLSDSFIYNDHLQDVNLDGIMDLVVHTRTQETGIQCGDSEAMLTGALLSGDLFLGTDALALVGCEASFGQHLWLNQRERMIRTGGRVIEPKLQDSDDSLSHVNR